MRFLLSGASGPVIFTQKKTNRRQESCRRLCNIALVGLCLNIGIIWPQFHQISHRRPKELISAKYQEKETGNEKNPKKNARIRSAGSLPAVDHQRRRG